MSFSWQGSSSSSFLIPKIGSSKKVISLSKSKNRSSAAEASTSIKQATIVDSLDVAVKQDPDKVRGKGKGRMEEPLYILEKMKKSQEQQQQLSNSNSDIEMAEDDDDDSFWQSAAEVLDKSVTAATTTVEKDVDMDDMVDTETPRFESLSVKDDTPTTPPETASRPLKRKRVGEDVFTRDAVKQWQGSRIKAWENRYMSPEGFYYRFVAPGEGQQNGGWSLSEHKLFMKRYDEWIAKGYKIGASWGLFSCGVPHRVGYQCMNYYRKLVSDGKLQDESYIVENGKLKQVHKERLSGTIPTTELGPEWKDEEVKEEERNVDKWLKEFHGRSGKSITSKPIAPPKSKAAPRVVQTTTRRTNTNSITDLVKNMPPKQYIPGGDDDFMMMESSDPEVAHLQARDWETEWRERIENYEKFLVPYHDKRTRDQFWFAKQEWRRSLITTEMLLQKGVVRKTAQPPPSATTYEPPAKIQQSSLSRFFTGVKKRKVDTPDEFISHVRIPNDLYSGVKRIQPLSQKLEADVTRHIYMELDDMNDCAPLLDDLLAQSEEEKESRQSALECILVDPPWEFYVADGKNDGSCTWNLSDFQKLMEKVASHMSAGMIFVWVHKLIQADVVRMMYTIDCKYVENLVWFKKSVNNVELDDPSPYISSTKEILLMFKKGEGFELRHQRSPDVIIDFEQPKQQWIKDEYTEPKPPGVYDTIETLLPKAAYDESINRGRFLELWAKKNAPRRQGWIAFHENKAKVEATTAKKEKKEKETITIKTEMMLKER